MSFEEVIKIPTYSFHCTSCDSVFDRVVKIADREAPLTEECPNCKTMGCITRWFQGANIEWGESTFVGSNKTPSDWRNFVSAIKKANPGKGGDHIKD